MLSSMIAILAVAHAIPFQAIEVRHRANMDPGSYPVLKHFVASGSGIPPMAGFESRRLDDIRIHGK